MKTVVGVVVGFVMFIVVLVIPLMGGGGAPPEDEVAGVGSGAQLDAGQIPPEYVPVLKKAAGYCADVSAPALAAQIKGESNWNPKAGSPVGAQGLSQFMPGTWAEWGKDANDNGTNSPFDPADAVDAQARFMCNLVDLVKGGLRTGRLKGEVLTLAWAAYNAGPGAVLRFGGVPPFAETQKYVVKLREFMQQYTAVSTGTGGGDVKASGPVMNPLQGQSYRLVSGFGPRPRPCPSCSALHQGQDLAIPTGAPVRSGCTGHVVHADAPGLSSGGMGKAVVVHCGGGIRMMYAHNSALQVVPGAAVKVGQVIAISGNSGSSTGPHLHFEIRTGSSPAGHWYGSGTAIDPIPWMKKNGAPL